MVWTPDSEIIPTAAKYLGIAIAAFLGVVGTVRDRKDRREESGDKRRSVRLMLVGAIILSSIIGAIGQYYDDRARANAQNAQIMRLRHIASTMNRFSGKFDLILYTDITHEHLQSGSGSGTAIPSQPIGVGPREIYVQELLNRPCSLTVSEDGDGGKSYDTKLMPDRDISNLVVLSRTPSTLTVQVLLHSEGWTWNSWITSVGMLANKNVKLYCGNNSQASMDGNKWMYSMHALKLLDGSTHLYLGTVNLSPTEDGSFHGRLIMSPRLANEKEGDVSN